MPDSGKQIVPDAPAFRRKEFQLDWVTLAEGIYAYRVLE